MTGATGTVGRPLVRALRARGAAVRALVRNAGEAPAEWDDGVEPVVADLNDPGSLAAAAAGIEAVHLLTPVGPDAARQARNVIDAVAGAGRPKVVLQAAIGVRRRTVPVRFFDAHTAALDHLESSGLPWTVLAPNGFLQNFLALLPDLRRTGTLALPAGDAAVSYVDARDIAEVAATVLTTGGHEGAVLDVTGPRAMDHDEVAERLGAALGRQLTCRALTPEQARTALLGTGMSTWQADGLVELYGRYASGAARTVSDTVPRLLGRPALPIETFLADHATALRAGSAPSQENR
ncbi:SDR family oxidoreductase [Streptomyces endophytica]|uniref:SDR family oxidoreductase n=1 Tax=Streptomyces endophytica TaxID=2991496 RepID=A0ABY6PE23_9ACTN|nr:SDR family oxidoreductase [Streptomyces endophytica]UZJ32085.1 SDR family oxidoreductase [Streptomyces endophytica]